MTLFHRTDRDHTDCPACKLLDRREVSADNPECCPPSAGPFSAPRKFDIVHGKHVPRPCCKRNLEGNHFGPFGGPGGSDQAPDAAVDGYGWPPADYRPWGETERVIDGMIAEDQAAWTIGDPFGAMDDYPQPGPLGRVYLAGPMRGVEHFNFPAFHNAAKGLREQGWGVFNPAEYDEMGGFDATGLTGNEDLTALGFSLRNALGKDLEFITGRADAVAVLPGWENSKGARAEVATARALGLPVFDALEGAARPIEDHGRATVNIVNRWVEPKVDVEKLSAAMSRAGKLLAAGIPEPVATQTVDDEVRTTSSTGGQKGVKLARYDLIPAGPLKALAEHFGRGAAKYDDHQWRKGYEWSKSAAASQRHFWDFWSGADYDVCPADGQGCQHVDQHGQAFTPIPSPHGATCYNHTGSHHLDAFMWHGFVMRELYDKFPEFDDRYQPEASA